MKRKLNMKKSLRLYITFVSICTICSAFLLSTTLVILYFSLFHRDNITHLTMIFSIPAICTLTVIIGGIAMTKFIKTITDPIEQISIGAKEVAKGNFKVVLRINRQDEIGELAVNFTKMVEELNGMDYMRKDFISNVSHELKTPVAAISGFAEILYDGKLTEEEEKEYLSYLVSETGRLNRLAANMLHMSRLDNQSIVGNKKNISLDEQIRKAILLLQEKWESKRIEFSLNLEKASYYGEEDMLLQVWINLIDNAIKFSEETSVITITEKNQSNLITVSIKDEGIGIRKEDTAKIFDKFYQCDVSHKKEGNGLGLSIVKRILQLMEGDIQCISQEKTGAEFIVTLPVKNNN